MEKYIKKFDTHSDYEDFIKTKDFIRPNVSYCRDNNEVHYNPTQTLFALEIESGRFISFYFQNGVLYANTDDGSSALWVCDGNGIVVDNKSYSIGVRGPILEQINEHYGTSFTGWSDNEINLRFGDTIPNWNAYEKIEIQSVYLKIPFTEILFAAGLLEGTTFKLYGMENDIVLQINNENGEVANTFAGATTMLQTYIMPKIREKGYEVESSIIDTTSYNIGDIIPNWEQYINVLS